jgi:basic membrane protein A
MPVPSRRLLLFGLLACSLATLACKKKRAARAPEPEVSTQGQTAEPALDFVVALVYSGPRDDGGFNSAQRAGVAALGRMMSVKVVEEENVPETGEATAYLEKVVALREPALVIATGMTHFDPALLTAAVRHPAITFLHCGGFYQEGKHPANAGSFYGNLDEAFYVTGVVAGMTTKTNRLGFIAGWARPAALRNLNAFTLGARSVNPRVTTQVVFTDSWSNAAAEEKAANALADARVDVLASFVRSPRVILQTAERRGLYSVGTHVDGSAFAPKGQLTAAVSSWERIYTDYVAAVRDHKPFPHVVRGGLAEGFVNIAPFGPAVSEAAKRKALDVRARLAQGRLTIFSGPLKDNRGAQVIADGQVVLSKDVALEQMSYLVEGVVGSLPD